MRCQGLVFAIFATMVASLLLACQPTTGELIGKGKSAQERGKFDEALEFYQQALVSDPENIDAMSAIGEVLLAQNKTDEAITQLTDTIEKAQGEGAKRAIGSLLADAEMKKAEELWRAGAYHADPKVAVKLEELALKVAEVADGQLKARAFGLLVSLYDFQFEKYRGEYDAAEESKQKELRDRELMHIDKVFRTVRPPAEFKRRLRDRVKELTESAFFEAANQRFEEQVKPVLQADENISVGAERITIVLPIPFTAETAAADLADPDVRALLMPPYYALAKRESMKVVQPIVAAMLGLPELKQSIRADRIVSFLVENEELFEDPTDASKGVKITCSLSLEEIRNLAFEYQLFLDTEAKIDTQKPGKKAAAQATDGPATDAPATDAPATDAPATP